MNRIPSLLARTPALVLALCLAAAAFAASPLVDARLTVALIQSNGPFETAAPATAAKPGDVLEYSARYNNRGSASADALMPTMPIPLGTEYVPSTLSPKPTEASLDAITYGTIPLRRRQVGADGKSHEVEVPLAEYRALRWSIGSLAAGSEVTVKARVRVAPTSSVASR